ncbi:monooxygenase [Pseudovirgaria hyperparasitica]|uniref:Monooxygenase n=1 Tax=Pseudovirgaria hyperparasitica TaxID=470096 RepID=A0A6A6WHW0_9PEZI|nr:monooxygenase [Pseudovirgaria hyperparasitica]KAF2762392.1 monooxygenase [Pseudovirgaria hyperparasitica]
MERDPDTGLSIIVTGAGIAGLSFAIEAYRKGHNVKVIERRANFEELSDMIAIQPSALRTPAKWPGFSERVRKIAWEPVLELWKYDGEHIDTMHTGQATDGSAALPIPRAYFHNALRGVADEVGIPISFSAVAEEFCDLPDSASVRLRDGQVLKADVIVAADGWRSKSRLAVGDIPEPISTGYSIYRAAYKAEEAMRNTILKEHWRRDKSQLDVFFGADAHAFVGKSEDMIFWTLTRRDRGGNLEEDLADFQVPIQEAQSAVNGWAPLLSALVQETPSNAVIDWKLTWRDPDPRWSTPNGRIVQIGDAAHTFLPTSASGATMAMEDAFTLATCLAMTAKTDVARAIQVYITLRYMRELWGPDRARFERVAAAQKMGIKNRERFHHLDWDEIRRDPAKVMGQIPKWISDHDPEQYAVDNFDECMKCILIGTRFENTNSVPGYKYEDWTLKDLMETVERGEKILDDGDWT